MNIHWKDWCWSWSSNTVATGCKELTHWKRPRYWGRLRAGREGDDRGRDGWMASRTQWTWVWEALGVGEGQETLVCCSPWGHKESGTTERLNNNIFNLQYYISFRCTTEWISIFIDYTPFKIIIKYWLYSMCWTVFLVYYFFIHSSSYVRRWWHPTPVLLPGKSHGWRSLVGCRPWGCEELDTTERLPFRFSLSCTGEGNGKALQCSCLENSSDGGAWWAAVYGVTQSRTRLKCFSSSSSSLYVIYFKINILHVNILG